jgi:hypothetical protein
VGKRENYVKVTYLQNDKQQDGGSTNVSLIFLFLMIVNGWIWQVKFGTGVNCSIFTHYIENNTSFKLFIHEAM